MKTRRVYRVLSATALALAACGDDPQPACDAGTLADRLAGAGAGDTVEVGACRIAGSFTVPAGVTITGAGRGATVIVGADGGVALNLHPGSGDGTTVARDLSVEARGRVGLLVAGEGRALIERVTVEADRGVALGAADPSSLVLRDVALLGPVTEQNATDIGPPDSLETAVVGLLVIDSPETTIEHLSARGFAEFGAVLYGSSGTWTGGELTENLGTALLQAGGALAIQDVSVTRTLQGSNLVPSFAMAILDGADVDSTGLVIDDNEAYGIVQAASTARHLDLVARGNADAAMWVQDATSLVIQGGMFEDNAFAGIVALRSAGLDLSDLSITRTRRVTVMDGEQEVGDGIQLVGTTDDVQLERVELLANERVGLLADLSGDSGAGIDLRSVTVDGTEDAYGVIVQGGTPAEDWDDGVTRAGATIVNDAAFLSAGSALPVADPTTLPAVDEELFRGLIGPNE